MTSRNKSQSKNPEDNDLRKIVIKGAYSLRTTVSNEENNLKGDERRA